MDIFIGSRRNGMLETKNQQASFSRLRCDAMILNKIIPSSIMNHKKTIIFNPNEDDH